MPPKKKSLVFEKAWAAEDVSSGESDSDAAGAGGARRRRDQRSSGSDSEGEDDFETPAQKRVRVAKEYLAAMQAKTDAAAGGSGGESDSDVDVAERLRRAQDREAGRAFHRVAASLREREEPLEVAQWFTGMKLSATCVGMAPDGCAVYAGSKDNGVYAWDVETGARTALSLPHHRQPRDSRTNQAAGEILALAVSPDGALVAAGGRERVVKVWDVRSGEQVCRFTGHQDAVSALAFRQGADSRQLFSGGLDRLVKHWNVEEKAFVETLFGHQSEITCMDAGRKERCLTGGADQTLRLWKIADESQLLFRRRGGAVDAVCMLSDAGYASGSQDGGLSLWHIAKKRATREVAAAHGAGHWISALASVRTSDLMASGSSDGAVRFWRASTNEEDPGLEEVATAPVPGFVNGLSFSASGGLLAAAVGKEPKLGRWGNDRSARNGVAVVRVGVSL